MAENCRCPMPPPSRAASLPVELVPELAAAAERAGLRWADFRLTDNSCPPHPPPRSLVAQLQREVEQVGSPAWPSLAPPQNATKSLA